MRQRLPKVGPAGRLEKWLKDRGFTQDELSRLMTALDSEVSAKRHKINRVLNGRTEFSERERLVLERLTEIPADDWLPKELRRLRTAS